jgi:osmotically inducible protein OsmC
MKILYTAIGTATGGRTGTASNPDGSLNLTLARPKDMGGPGGGTNPEELFACGYAACFASTLDHLARQRKIILENVAVVAHVGLAQREDNRYALTAELQVSLPSVAREDAEALLAAAHQTCPYSNATRGNVDVKLTLT